MLVLVIAWQRSSTLHMEISREGLLPEPMSPALWEASTRGAQPAARMGLPDGATVLTEPPSPTLLFPEVPGPRMKGRGSLLLFQSSSCVICAQKWCPGKREGYTCRWHCVGVSRLEWGRHQRQPQPPSTTANGDSSVTSEGAFVVFKPHHPTRLVT